MVKITPLKRGVIATKSSFTLKFMLVLLAQNTEMSHYFVKEIDTILCRQIFQFTQN